MDVSEEYIRMCDCPEIQRDSIQLLDYHKLHGKIYIDLGGNFWVDNFRDDPTTEFTPSIWLPRQDQIQEMLEIATADDFRNVVDDMFYERDSMGLYDNLNDKWFVEELKTPEQLWLAFYMYEKHARIWSGKEWVPAT